jgi:dienelactone hydrolase
MVCPGRRRRMAAVLGALGSALVLGACTVPAPPGDAPLRYRDIVFSGVTVTSDLTYGSAPDLQGNPVTLTLDLYRPTGDTQTGRPAIVWIHGGGFSAGDKTRSPFPALARQFAKRGYVAASINYRLLGTERCAGVQPVPQSCMDAAVAAQHDAQAAVRWLRAHAAEYGIDPTRIAVGGGSAGAATALLVGAHSEDPGSSGTPGQSSNVGGVISISGVLPPEGQALFTPDDAPTLWFIGTDDPLITDENRVLANAGALYNQGVLSVPEVLQGAGHVPISTDGPTIYTQSAYFLYFTLDLAHAAGSPPGNAAATDAMARRLLRSGTPRSRPRSG